MCIFWLGKWLSLSITCYLYTYTFACSFMKILCVVSHRLNEGKMVLKYNEGKINILSIK
jgi:hypothetical protein